MNNRMGRIAHLFCVAFSIFFLSITHTLTAQNEEISRLKGMIAPQAEDEEQVGILVQLAAAEADFDRTEALRNAREALKMANKINYLEGQADAQAIMGRIYAFNYEDPVRAADAHQNAYKIYKKLYQEKKISREKIYNFLRDNAMPSYKILVEKDRSKRKDIKAMQRYAVLNGEFVEYVEELAARASESLQKTEKDLKKTETSLKTTETKLLRSNTELLEKQATAAKLALDKALLTGTLGKAELRKIQLADSLKDVQMNLQRAEIAQRMAEIDKEKTEKTNVVQAERLQRQRVWNIVWGVAIILSVLLLAVITVFLMRTRSVNKALTQQRNELKRQNEEINQQKEEILSQRDNIEQQNVMLHQQKEEILTQRDNIQQQNVILQQHKEEIEAQRDNLQEVINELEVEKSKTNQLLNILMPAQIAEELKRNGSVQPKSYEMVTVMFTDFKGFTKIAEQLTPQQIVQELNICFQAFDEIIKANNLEKIKTMGDGYMCAGGLPNENNTNPFDAIRAGLAMLEFMDKLRQEKLAKGQPVWELRVGIHTGAVVAGVIGKDKFAYDIWGDTVNVASRLEASGEPGKVNISGETYQLVKSEYNCTYRGKIFAKNKGDIDMYFVEGKSTLFQGLLNLKTSA